MSCPSGQLDLVSVSAWRGLRYFDARTKRPAMLAECDCVQRFLYLIFRMDMGNANERRGLGLVILCRAQGGVFQILWGMILKPFSGLKMEVTFRLPFRGSPLFLSQFSTLYMKCFLSSNLSCSFRSSFLVSIFRPLRPRVPGESRRTFALIA